MSRLNLFDDDGSSPDDDISKIEINHEYAKRYEFNKKREELQKFEELKKQGRVDSDSESSEEEELTKPSKKADSKFFDALIKVKKQDPILLNKDAKLFDSEDDDDSEDSGEENGEEKKKPMHLRTVIAKQLIELGPEFNDEDDAGDKNVKTYSEEQEEHRRAFLEAVAEEENDEEGDFLTVKNNASKDEDDKDDDFDEKLEEYFDEDEKLDEESKFLKDYFRSRMWVDDGKNNNLDDEIEVSEDEEEIERQEDYERDFNFRYEENAGDRILGHSRRIEGSVRKKENARKSQRERKEERMMQAEFERKEELKRLKNLKKKEINEKLEKIREVAGIGKDESVFLDDDDLEDEFDPEAYDRKMKEAFGDGYYDAKDADPGFGTDDDEDEEKPDFDKEDELLGLEKGWDEANGSRDGFLSTRERILKEKVDVIDEAKEGKRKRKRKLSEVAKAVKDELLEEYYKLDYEGTIGDLKTRFKYRPVKKRKFGLRPEDVLMLDDKELNEYVSLKKIAPYREEEWKVPRVKTVQLKQRLWGEVRKDKGKAVEKEGSESKGETGSLSRKVQRRRRQAELKLSQSRLMAYGKIPSKAKSKKKQ
ncbi:protein kri1 [Phtheirospermum japonicum]|uniref:Protein kri1 n=1 Tax=Phtheirospermum japonicum TaxID=374723 RepID=A0A830BXS6_9LAMI|nr:protein kri1 [Phtheirospermum japonicum]